MAEGPQTDVARWNFEGGDMSTLCLVCVVPDNTHLLIQVGAVLRGDGEWKGL